MPFFVSIGAHLKRRLEVLRADAEQRGDKVDHAHVDHLRVAARLAQRAVADPENGGEQREDVALLLRRDADHVHRLAHVAVLGNVVEAVHRDALAADQILELLRTLDAKHLLLVGGAALVHW
jgi:hypothetical protein